MFKIFQKAAVMLTVTAGVGTGFPALADEPISLTYSAFSSSSSPNHRLTIDKMIEEIELASNGKIKFETYFGGTAYGNAQRQFDQVQRGLVDVAHGMFGYTPGRFPMADLIELPFLFEDSVAASRAFWIVHDKYLRESMPGVHPIAIWLTSMQQLHLRKPVDSLEDMSGLKIRAGGALMVETLGAFGAEGILTPAPAIYESMEKGVLDGAIGAWGMLRAFNIGEVSSHHIDLKISASPLFILMNEKKYQSLPDDIKVLFDAYSTPDAVGLLAESFEKSDVAGFEIAKSAGHTIKTLTQEERNQWRSKVAPVIEAHIEAMEAKGLPARAFIEDVTAEYERQVNAKSTSN